jgi:AraC family transcriptional regulator, arabinose operon regulatory protein
MDSPRFIDAGTYLSTLQVDVTAAAFTHVPPDWRDIDYVPAYNKFYFIQDGEGVLEIGGRRYAPGPGELYLLPEGVRQSYSVSGKNTFTKYWCHFTARVGSFNLFDVVPAPDFIRVGDGEKAIGLFRDLIAGYGGNDVLSALRMKAAMLELIAFYLECAGAGSPRLFESEKDERLRRVLRFIDETLASAITVERLADIAHLQPNYFIGYFKSRLGVTPMRYVHLRRIDLAKRLLTDSTETVSEIAERIGFGDPYHFSRSFKEFSGYTPTEYRSLSGNRAD